MNYCPVCERKYGDETRFCGVDGAPLKAVSGGDAGLDSIAGKTIKGRYDVLKKLGEGGMGTVYLAEQVSIGRKVALKLLQGNYAKNDEFITRFRREARLAASLNHRNIVTVHDFDQDADGTLFLAMEYVDGKKLTDLIRRDGPLDIQRAVRLGAQIADGLDAAHRQGVIHRDIKPDNIMVIGIDDAEEVKLMDFGIARLRDAGTMSHLTQTGMIMGTPAYMAPEQAEGTEVSERTDIYALGIVLYEMLSGSVPFRASTPGAVLVKQMQETPLPLRNLRREVPAWIERVVMQALEKKPENRQRDMREVAQGLKRIEKTIVEAPALRTVVREPTIVGEVPRTIAATQVSTGEFRDKIKRANSRFLGLGLIGVVVFGGLVFGVVKLADRSSLDTAKKEPAVVAEPVKEPVNAPPSEAAPTGDSVEREPSRIVPEPSTRMPAPADVSGQKLSLKPKSPIDSKTKDRISLPRSNPPQRAADEKKPDAEPIQGSNPSQRASDEPKSNPEPSVAQKPATNAKIQDYVRVAKNLRERGEYEDASKELEKARAIDPTNSEVHLEIERTQKACHAEKRLGRAGLRC